LRSSLWTPHDVIASRLFRNVHHLCHWAEAAYGCLKPAPESRLRRTYLHLWYSMVLQKKRVLLDTRHSALSRASCRQAGRLPVCPRVCVSNSQFLSLNPGLRQLALRLLSEGKIRSALGNWRGRMNDENSRGNVQNVRGDSSARRRASPGAASNSGAIPGYAPGARIRHA